MVKPGYKQTEIGVIPEDWSCVPLLSKCELLNGLTYTPEDVKDFGLLVIRSSNIQNNQLIFDDNVYVGLDVPTEKLIKKNDIVICVRNGSISLIGKCAKANLDYPITFGAFMAVLRGENNNYIFQLFQQGTIQRNISKSSGATINQITNTDFKNIIIPVPENSAEQHRIADALSNMDELIESLGKLIAKKKAIKQAAMQELLTGKRRLPGFTGEWEFYSIDDIAELCTDTIPVESFDIRYYIGTENMISNKGGISDNKIDIPYSVVRKYQTDDIILSNIRPYLKKIWFADKNGGCSNDVFVIRIKDKQTVVPAFLYYCLCQDGFFNEMMANAIGTKMPRGDKAVILRFCLQLPRDIEEQISIVNTLNDIDCSIERIEAKLAKARQIKKGMMQQLLTGKIRLV